MNTTLLSLVLDAAEPDAESAFWHRLLGGSLSTTDSHHFLQVEGMPVLVVQRVPGHLPPDWPDGGDQQMHFDLRTDDPAATDRLAVEAGGRRLRPAPGVDLEQHPGALVYASPAGHPFCVRPA
ncbi:VOC family protein [Amycolatopsis ultiminotia]|uniref:VOC family protein n=1 Tax=Amycolatopsis ultiminotia TaxID=543629 RepID=A0ABP6Y845_9PSEU